MPLSFWPPVRWKDSIPTKEAWVRTLASAHQVEPGERWDEDFGWVELAHGIYENAQARQKARGQYLRRVRRRRRSAGTTGTGP